MCRYWGLVHDRTPGRHTPHGQYSLGVMYERGTGVAQNLASAHKWYTLAANQGVCEAQRNLGIFYRDGLGVREDHLEACKWFRKGAEAGMAMAQYELARMHHYGGSMLPRDGPEQMPVDTAEAIKWYTRANAQGFLHSLHDLGVLYKCVLGDESEACKWFQLAADRGVAFSQCNLAIAYSSGLGVPVDKVKAVKLARSAAVQGLSAAQCNLAGMYERGEGTPRNRPEAVKFYSLAAAQGNTQAQYDLAKMCASSSYRGDTDVAAAMAEATRMYDLAANQRRSAAEKGDARAQRDFGEMHLGHCGQIGFVADLREASKWYKLSAAQGDSFAKDMLAQFVNCDVDTIGMRIEVAGLTSSRGRALNGRLGLVQPGQINRTIRPLSAWHQIGTGRAAVMLDGDTAVTSINVKNLRRAGGL